MRQLNVITYLDYMFANGLLRTVQIQAEGEHRLGFLLIQALYIVIHIFQKYFYFLVASIMQYYGEGNRKLLAFLKVVLEVDRKIELFNAEILFYS